MFFRKKIWLLLLTGSFFACETDVAQVKQLTSAADAMVERGGNVRILYSDSGRLKVELIAPKLDHYNAEDPYTEMPDGFKLIFFNDSARQESVLTANYGISHEKEQTMTAKGNVEAVNAKGEKLFTEELVWDEKKGLIYSDEFVKIETPDEIIYGEGFEANQDFSSYKIKKITGTISVETDDQE